MIADDEDDIEMLKAAVKECPVKVNVSVAKDARALLTLLEQEHLLDLIVLDLNMPYMNGYDCLSSIRRNERYKHVPILILSTSVLKSDIDYCLGRRATYYAVKPSNLKDLENLIKVLYNGIMVNRTAEQA